MSFYIGSYLILQDSIDLKHDSDSWSLPDVSGIAGHMGQTSNVEELLIRPEDMTLIPTQIQFGLAEWSADEGFEPDHEAYKQFYVRDESFYTRNFVGVDFWTPSWYASGAYYVQPFTGVDFFTDSFYTPLPSWYVRPFSGTDFFTDSFYTPEPSWYVRSFSPTGSLWSEFYPGNFL